MCAQQIESRHGKMFPSGIQDRTVIDDRTTRMGPRLGWLLLSAGVLLLYGYGIFSFLVDTSEPIWVRLGLAGIGLGILILFLHVLRQRLIARKTDPYKDVEE